MSFCVASPLDEFSLLNATSCCCISMGFVTTSVPADCQRRAECSRRLFTPHSHLDGATGSLRQLQQAQPGEFRPQRRRIDELDAVNPKASRRVDVLRDGVDENGAMRVEAMSIEQDFVDAPVRFDRSDLARNDDALEQPQEVEALARQRIVSAEKLLNRYKGVPRACSSARMSTVPLIGPAIISSNLP